MPKWAWWVAAVLLFVLWNYDSFGEYWFGGWWTTVRDKPLGAWHAVDLLPFIAAYFAIRPISEAIVSIPNLNESKQP
jgi:hypothetical protein